MFFHTNLIFDNCCVELCAIQTHVLQMCLLVAFFLSVAWVIWVVLILIDDVVAIYRIAKGDGAWTPELDFFLWALQSLRLWEVARATLFTLWVKKCCLLRVVGRTFRHVHSRVFPDVEIPWLVTGHIFPFFYFPTATMYGSVFWLCLFLICL